MPVDQKTNEKPTPLIADNGIIYLDAQRHESSCFLTAIDETGAILWQEEYWNEFQSGSNIASDGTLYLISGYDLLAFRTSSTGPGIGSWPMQHHDPHHSGKNR